MEKRKLLLVAVSVGVFLVIVLSAAILIFTPGGGGAAIARSVPAGESASGTNPRLPASADAADMVRNTGELQGLKVPPPGVAPPGSNSSESSGASASPSASAVQENNFYFSGENSVQTSAAERGGSAGVVIDVPKPSAPGVPSSSSRSANTQGPASQTRTGQGSAPAVSPVPSTASGTQTASGAQTASNTAAPRTASPSGAGASKPRTASPSTAVQTAPSTAVVKSSAAPAARTPATPAQSRVRAQQDYWIQTGAFSALIRAENAKEILATKGLISIIDDREVDGQIWYRVRVGPYTSENEAAYWLALVRAIDGFDQSQVRSSQR